MKQRGTIYAVLRFGNDVLPTILDSFRTYERAQEVCGIYEQQMKERGLEGFIFQVQTTTYYND
jgi:hypothetical protein